MHSAHGFNKAALVYPTEVGCANQVKRDALLDDFYILFISIKRAGLR
jgi:hypothetical protein